jgi:hypothetical protein
MAAPDRSSRGASSQAAGWAARVALLLGTVSLALRVVSPARPGAQPAGGSAGSSMSAEAGDSGRGDPSLPPSAQARARGHETEDMDGSLMLRLFLLLAGIAAVMVAGMIGLERALVALQASDRPPLTAEQTTGIDPPEPHLETHPLSDYARFQSDAEQRLNAYGWLGPEHTRASIPIDRAMALSVGRTLDAPAP